MFVFACVIATALAVLAIYLTAVSWGQAGRTPDSLPDVLDLAPRRDLASDLTARRDRLVAERDSLWRPESVAAMVPSDPAAAMAQLDRELTRHVWYSDRIDALDEKIAQASS